MNDAEALVVARRLSELGIVVRSAELQETADAHARLPPLAANRAMRRARERSQRRRGR